MTQRESRARALAAPDHTGDATGSAAGTSGEVRGRRVGSYTYFLAVIPLFIVLFLCGRFILAGMVFLAGSVGALWARRRSATKITGTMVAFSIAGSLLVLFIVLPIANLLLTSEVARMQALARDRSVQAAVLVTFGTGLTATFLSVLFGIPLGYVLARQEFAGKAIVEGIVDLPVVIPQTIAGIALVFVFGRAGIVGAHLNSSTMRFSDSYWGIVTAMLFVSVPFMVNYARDGFMGVDPRLEYVARSLGASQIAAFLRITIPLSWRALLSGAILAWARATSEFIAVSVIAYYPKTVNTILYEWYNFFGYAHVKPLAALIVLVTLLVFVILRTIARPQRARL